MSVLALFVRAPACRLTSVLRVRAGGRPMLTSADALRRFLETLKDYEKSIADLRHSMQRLASGDANSPELTRLPKKLHRVQTVDLQGRIHTLDTLTHELLLANIESLKDARRALGATPARILPGPALPNL